MFPGDNYLISPNATPDPNPFFESSTDSLNESRELNNAQNNLDDFEINDIYIDDDIEANENYIWDPEPSPGHNYLDLNFDPNTDSDLDHYLVGPDGIYLHEIQDNSFDLYISNSDNDSVLGLDPEPSPGPVDPGSNMPRPGNIHKHTYLLLYTFPLTTIFTSRKAGQHLPQVQVLGGQVTFSFLENLRPP